MQRFSFRELGEELAGGTPAGARVFQASGRPKQAQPPAPPPPPVFNEEEMKVAERDGYKKGFLDGTQESRNQAESEQAEVNRQLTGLVDRFSETILPLFNDYSQMLLQLKKDVPAAALAIARKVAGDALNENSHDIITGMAARYCETMMHEPKLTITVRETLADTLEAKLKEQAARLPANAHIVIVRDPDMPVTDCKIDWERGSMERNVEHVWQQVEKAVDDISATSVRDTEQHLDNLKNNLPPGDDNNPDKTKE